MYPLPQKYEAEQLFSTFIIIPNVSSAYYTFCVCAVMPLKNHFEFHEEPFSEQFL